MQTVLITGANRGLGLEFCRQYAEAGWRVLGGCRNPAAAAQLNTLAGGFENFQVESLDVADFSMIDSLSERLADVEIDLLINNAGIYSEVSGRGFGNLDYHAWGAALRINAQAPVKMAEAFLPQIERSGKKLIVSISSLMGSITDNTSGGSILYRSSKAALNAAMKSLAIDLKVRAVGVLILHPGWVRTDMGGRNALIDVDESVAGMRSVIEGFSLERTGSFISYEGSLLSW